jgi:hypothetical protein
MPIWNRSIVWAFRIFKTRRKCSFPTNSRTKRLTSNLCHDIDYLTEFLFFFFSDLLGYNSRDSSVGIATKLRAGFNSRQGLGIFRHRVQTCSGTHWAFYPTGVGGSFPRGIKRVGHEADHTSPSSVDVMNAWSCPPLPQYVFIACCLVRYTSNSTFTFLSECYITFSDDSSSVAEQSVSVYRWTNLCFMSNILYLTKFSQVSFVILKWIFHSANSA